MYCKKLNSLGFSSVNLQNVLFWFFLAALCLVAEAVQSQCDMAEELSRQLEDILSTYCRESSSDDASTLPNGESHSPDLNGMAREDNKPDGGKVNGANVSGEKEQRKSHEKKKVKGLGKEIILFIRITSLYSLEKKTSLAVHYLILEETLQ